LTDTKTMTPVIQGSRCVGFILARGRLGFEAFDEGEASLGTFSSQRKAWAAIAKSDTGEMA
jgi:hypothetical protein